MSTEPQSSRMSYSTAVEQLAFAQKPGIGVPAYTRWVNRWAARYVAALAYRLNLSPNAVSAISAAFSSVAIGILILVPPDLGPAIAIAALLATGYLFDSADGQVARLTGRSSSAGEWLDHVVDAIRTPAIHLAVLIGWFRFTDLPLWALALPLLYTLAVVGQFMSQILAEQLSRRAGQAIVEAGTSNRQSFVLIPTDTGTFCWIFVLWGSPDVFVWVYGLMLLLNGLHTLISMRRKYLRLIQPIV